MNAQDIKKKINAALKETLKIEEREYQNPYEADKSSVLLDAREFSKSPIDGERCCRTITKTLYLLNQGEQLTAAETTDFFFGVTKLFQSNHRRLRRMVYLIIKLLDISETEVFIVTSCLTKDMSSKNDVYRANSIKVLARILDPSMAQQIDRYLKTAIVDKNAFVASSALVCGATLSDAVPEVVRRWVNEIQEATSSKHAMVQFHALALLYELKKNDRLALHKVVTGLTRQSLGSPMAECLLVRYATMTLLTERDQTVERTLMAYLDSCLRTKHEMVTFEAARAFCRLAATDKSDSASVFGYDFVHALTVLQIFLTSPKPVVRFGAIRALNELSQHRPLAVSRCNADMEPLLTDSNRHVATLALTTLLKTGHESNVERLVKKITGFMSEIGDTFKIEVVRAVKSLCLQYPNKHPTLLSFLANNLREEGAFEFKRYLAESIIAIVEAIPAAKESGLLFLADFIEDCEYHGLCARIIGFIGAEACNTRQPAKFIRFIYNRLILENAPVRAAAVTSLLKIAQASPDLVSDVRILLQACANDSDDEVRDRIADYLALLGGAQKPVTDDAPFSLDAFLVQLEAHCKAQPDTLFDHSRVPSEGEYQASMAARAAQQAAEKPTPGLLKPVGPAAAPAPAPKKVDRGAELAKVAAGIAQGAELGELLMSAAPDALTETEAEYTVNVIKHIYASHVMFEFVVANTVPGVTLESVRVAVGACPNWKNLGQSLIPELATSDAKSAYCLLEKLDLANLGTLTGRFTCALHFLLKEEGDDLGVEDDYSVEAISMTVGDYVLPKPLGPGMFKTAWEQLPNEYGSRYALPFKSLELAVPGLSNLFHMAPCEKSEAVEAGAKGANLLLSGTFVGGNAVLAKCVVAFHPSRGCVMQIVVRSKSDEVSQCLCRALE